MCPSAPHHKGPSKDCLSVLKTWQLAFLRANDPRGSTPKTKAAIFKNLTSKVIYHHFCHILLVTETNPDAMWDIPGCQYQEWGSLGSVVEAGCHMCPSMFAGNFYWMWNGWTFSGGPGSCSFAFQFHLCQHTHALCCPGWLTPSKEGKPNQALEGITSVSVQPYRSFPFPFGSYQKQPKRCFQPNSASCLPKQGGIQSVQWSLLTRAVWTQIFPWREGYQEGPRSWHLRPASAEQGRADYLTTKGDTGTVISHMASRSPEPHCCTASS